MFTSALFGIKLQDAPPRGIAAAGADEYFAGVSRGLHVQGPATL